jgi:hypothetical protein
MSYREEVKLYFKTLEKDFDLYREVLQEVAVDIRSGNFSGYPIFVASRLPLDVGELMLNRDEFESSWSIYASTLEEFIEKGLISKDKLEQFRQTYKDPEVFCCIFLVTNLGASFVFIPWKPDNKSIEFNPN